MKYKNENINKIKEHTFDKLDYEDDMDKFSNKFKFHKYLIEYPEKSKSFEGFANSKKIAKEYAAQKFLIVIIEF